MTHPHPKPQPRHINLGSVVDGAELLNVNPRTIRRMISTGQITGYKVGRLVKVDLDELLERGLRVIPAAKDAS